MPVPKSSLANQAIEVEHCSMLSKQHKSFAAVCCIPARGTACCKGLRAYVRYVSGLGRMVFALSSLKILTTATFKLSWPKLFKQSAD
jgi:hypothetical protein